MKKLLAALLALTALGFYVNTTATVASAPVVNQSQVELAVVKAPGLHQFDNTVEQVY